mmetsp:Transcript_15787/g.37261  ORF Transcript_15787/g.37261 Transcript_15787/m.37261 type:complete len:145 (+) Transcript_15787:215-649(+)
MRPCFNSTERLRMKASTSPSLARPRGSQNPTGACTPSSDSKAWSAVNLVETVGAFLTWVASTAPAAAMQAAAGAAVVDCAEADPLCRSDVEVVARFDVTEGPRKATPPRAATPMLPIAILLEAMAVIRWEKGPGRRDLFGKCRA